VLLDIYPLGRLSWHVRQWFSPEARRVWREKIPFVVVALAFALIALFSQRHAAALKSLEIYGLEPRFAQALYGAVFYLWKTVAPSALSPLYEIPPDYSLSNLPSLIGGVVVLVFSFSLLLLKDRWPAGLACWLYYLLLLAPVLGLAQSGPQLVADRYSYLSCLSWTMLGGGILLLLLRRIGGMHVGLPAAASIGAGALTITLALAYLTWQQCTVWRNTETLWAHVVKLYPDSSYGHYNLAREIARKGKYQEAVYHYREALRIRPNDVDAHNNLGLVLARTGQIEPSLAEFRRATEINPLYAKGYFNLGRVLSRRGDFEGAAANLRKALELHPQEAEIHLALGAVLARQGHLAEAGERFEEAVRVNPNSADAHTELARWLAGQGRVDKAADHYKEALRLTKLEVQQMPPSRNTAGADELSGTGKP
jgi:Tfp pilus assembly protein PilF